MNKQTLVAIRFSGTSIEGYQFNGKTVLGTSTTDKDALSNKLKEIILMEEGILVHTLDVSVMLECVK